MYGTRVILILGLFAMVHGTIDETAEPKEPKTIKPGMATEKDVDSIKKITFKQALPMIVFPKYQTLQFLVGLYKAKIQNGRFIFGTQFYTIPQDIPQIFLCPNKEAPNRCLKPVMFKDTDILECELEPVPLLVEDEEMKTCGPDGTSTRLQFVYKICQAEEPYEYNIKNLPIYTLCFNSAESKPLYVDYKLIAAKLLSEKLFEREQEVEFKMSEEEYGLAKPDFEQWSKHEEDYDGQTLIPPDDMALAVLTKPTYHFANVAMQHAKLIDLWDTINSLIRRDAIENFDSPRDIITGIWDVPRLPTDEDTKPKKEEHLSTDEVSNFGTDNQSPTDEVSNPKKEDQLNNIWVKIVMDKNGDAYKGLAILMNNFISTPTKTDNQSDGTSTLKKYPIDQICGQNFCIKSLTDEFTRVGGQVRCCELSKKILDLFQQQRNLIKIEKILQIRGITIDEK